jgi:hypothetical protein
VTGPKEYRVVGGPVDGATHTLMRGERFWRVPVPQGPNPDLSRAGLAAMPHAVYVVVGDELRYLKTEA